MMMWKHKNVCLVFHMLVQSEISIWKHEFPTFDEFKVVPFYFLDTIHDENYVRIIFYVWKYLIFCALVLAYAMKSKLNCLYFSMLLLWYYYNFGYLRSKTLEHDLSLTFIYLWANYAVCYFLEECWTLTQLQEISHNKQIVINLHINMSKLL